MRPNKSNGRLFRLKQSRQVSANALELSPIPEQSSREQLRDAFVAGSALMDPTADNELALKQEPASDQAKPFVTKANVAKQESTDMKSNAVAIEGKGLNYIDEAKLASEIDSLSERAVSILTRTKKKLEVSNEVFGWLWIVCLVVVLPVSRDKSRGGVLPGCGCFRSCKVMNHSVARHRRSNS
jgi:hypothetical protein